MRKLQELIEILAQNNEIVATVKIIFNLYQESEKLVMDYPELTWSSSIYREYLKNKLMLSASENENILPEMQR